MAAGGGRLVTERDLMRALHATAGALERLSAKYARRPLQTVRAVTFVYRAIGRMERLSLRHLAVTDDSNGEWLAW